MIRMIPDMQVGPIGYVLSWIILALIIIGFLFASTGGAIVWALFWIAVAAVVFVIISRTVQRLS